MKRSSILSVLLATALLIVGADYVAFAASGTSVILGKKNKTGATTTLHATKGAALKLKTKSSAPPLKVTSDKKVKDLNADLVDGLSSADLRDALTLKGRTVGDLDDAKTLAGRTVADLDDAVTLTGRDAAEIGRPDLLVWDVVSSRFASTAVELPLPVGTWRVSYDMWIDVPNQDVSRDVAAAEPQMASVETLGYCDVRAYGTDGYASTAPSTGFGVAGIDFVVSGSGVLEVAEGDQVLLVCEAQGAEAFVTSSKDASTVVAEAVDVTAREQISSVEHD